MEHRFVGLQLSARRKISIQIYLSRFSVECFVERRTKSTTAFTHIFYNAKVQHLQIIL